MTESVSDRVRELLGRHGVSFQVLRHEPVYTSQQAANVRGVPLASGAKALVRKGDDQFVMFVLPADLKLDSKAVRRARGWKKLRFADSQEVLQLTGLEPGSIPPFGSLFGLPTLCDARLSCAGGSLPNPPRNASYDKALARPATAPSTPVLTGARVARPPAARTLVLSVCPGRSR